MAGTGSASRLGSGGGVGVGVALGAGAGPAQGASAMGASGIDSSEWEQPVRDTGHAQMLRLFCTVGAGDSLGHFSVFVTSRRRSWSR